MGAQAGHLTYVGRLHTPIVTIFASLLLAAPIATGQEEIASRIRAAQSQGNYPEAALLYERLIASGVDSAEVRSNYGVMLHLSGKDTDALQQFRIALRTKPDLAGANLFAGIAEVDLGNARQALAYLEKAAKAEPRNPAPLLAMGSAYVALRNYDSANASYNRAAGLAPDLAEAWYGVGITYRSMAERILNRAATEQADGAGDAKQFLDKALNALNRAIQLDPGSARAHLLLAESLRDSGRVPESIQEYRTVLKLDPQMDAAYLGLATGYWKTRDFNAALPLLKRVLARSPKDPEANGIMADILEHTGDHQEAKRCAELALAGNPDLIETRFVLAEVYLGERHPKLAIEQLQRIAPADLSGKYHYLLYRAYMQEGDKEHAEAALKESQRRRYSAPRH